MYWLNIETHWGASLFDVSISKLSDFFIITLVVEVDAYILWDVVYSTDSFSSASFFQAEIRWVSLNRQPN